MPTVDPPDSTALAFAVLSQQLLSESSERTLQRVVQLAVDTVPGCDYAGVTLRHRSRLETPAATDPLVNLLDEQQYQLNEGPCVDAVQRENVYIIRDTRTETRWPKWAPRAAGQGVLSVLSVRMETPERVVGGLNLYSRTPDAFGNEALLTAHVYGMHASTAIAATHQIEHLAIGMRTRHLIGLAQGMLMMRYGLSEEQAFQFLTRTSQHENVKLRDIAQRVADELGMHQAPPAE
ncbi:MAG: GAF and ANTAR domain-containing protein [Actinomycetales bacterium]